MPFIVTTRREGRLPGKENDSAWSRCAVATLDEARTIMRAAQNSAPEEIIVPFSITESGGTVGPLPDGTVIEVEPVELSWLAARAEGFLPDEIIADFNAKQASA